MKPLVAQVLRSRWLAGLVHIALWLLLYLAIAGLGGRAPVYHEADGSTPAPRTPEPIGRLDRLFASGGFANISGKTNSTNPFFTRHFIPDPAPAPPPPTTKKIELTYQGFYSAAAGARQTMIKMGEKFLITPVGSNVTANLFAANATVTSLLLTNSSGQTNLLPVNVKREVEVPIK